MWCTRSRSRAYTEFPGRQAHNLAFSGASSPFCASSHSLACVRERPHIPSLLSLFTEHSIASFCLMRCAQIKNCSFFLAPLESLLLLRLLGIEEPADTRLHAIPFMSERCVRSFANEALRHHRARPGRAERRVQRLLQRVCKAAVSGVGEESRGMLTVSHGVAGLALERSLPCRWSPAWCCRCIP